MKDGKYPCQAKLIINPTSYLSGGDDAGLIGSAHSAGFMSDYYLYGDNRYGSNYTNARYVGFKWSYNIILLEKSSTFDNLISSNMITSRTWHEYSNYNLGQLCDDNQFFQILLRPVADDDTTVDDTKPFLFFPRAFVTSVLPFMWDRQVGHIDGTAINIIAMKHPDFTLPAIYGDVDNFPSIGGTA